MPTMTPTEIALAGDDKLVPFHVPGLEVRGRAVQLGPMLDAILSRHDYPPEVCRLLGEAIVLSVLLGTSLKFEGRFTIQTQTDGPVRLLVVDFATPDAVRAYAAFDAEQVEAARQAGETSPQALLGKGVMAMTVDQGVHMQRYQGIVELAGASLEEVAETYFRQSEQIPTYLRMAVGEAIEPNPGEGSVHNWRAGGILVQFLPDDLSRLTVRDLPGGDAPEGADDDSLNLDERDDMWVEARALVETVSDDELTDPAIGSERLLYRLFHEHGVHVFDGPAVIDKCTCSRERIVQVLRSMPGEELADLWQNGEIETNCEFCSKRYTVTPADLGE